MAKVGIYARISQSDPKVEKTADQVKRCRALAEREGHTVVDVFIDDGISAFTGKARPEWLRLIDAIERHEFDLILAVAEDRLARDAEEKIGFQVHCARHGVKWHTIASGLIDPSTAQGALLSTITGAVAQYESHVKRERILASVARRVAEQKDLGGPRPFGFEADQRTIRESEAAVVRGAYEAFLAGGSVWAATKFLNQSGFTTSTGKEWGWSTVRKLLARKRNAGMLEHKGTVIADDRPAIVPKELFWSVQALLEHREPAKRGPKPAALSVGIATCGRCGVPLQNGGAVYRCPTKAGTAPGERSARVRGHAHPNITRSILDDEVTKRLFIRLLEVSQAPEERRGDSPDVAALRLQAAEARRKRDVAQELAFAPGANVPLLTKQMAEIAVEIERLDADITKATLGDAGASIYELAREAIEPLGDGVDLIDGPAMFEAWKPRFAAFPIEKRRDMVRAMFTSIIVQPDRRGAERIDFDWLGKSEATSPGLALVEAF